MRKIARHWRSLGVAALLVAACVWAVPLATQLAPADPQRYLADIKTLTEPKMEGRGDGLKGLTRAEHVLVDRYKSLGLEPAGSQGYVQPFTLTTGAKLKGTNRFVVENGKTKHDAET
jgi:hypothetical protein